MTSLRSQRRTALGGILVLLLTASCDDDVSGPSAFTLESVWPNDDGRFWIYEGLQQNWEPAPYYRDWQPDRAYPTREHSQLALEVVYIIDYGISEVVTSVGETLYYFRPYSLGRVFYVPNVGPVQSEERGVYFVGEASPERPVMSQTLLLRETGRDILPERNVRARH